MTSVHEAKSTISSSDSAIWDLLSPLDVLDHYLRSSKNRDELQIVRHALERLEPAQESDTVLKIAEDILHRLSHDKNKAEIYSHLLSSCCRLNTDVLRLVLERIRTDMNGVDEESSINVGVPLTRAVLVNKANWPLIDESHAKSLFDSILNFIVDANRRDLTTRLKGLQLLSLCLSAFEATLVDQLARLWIHTIAASDVEHYLMCILVDAVVRTSSVIGDVPIEWEKFLGIVRTGLASSECLDRKQELYVLKRLLSDTKLMKNLLGGSSSSLWQDYVLVYETLEEKQVHLIEPVLPLLNQIVSATASDDFDFSWLGVLLERFCRHEVSGIMRLGIRLCFSENVTRCLASNPEGWNFLFGPLMNVLLHEPVFRRRLDEPSLGIVPPVAEQFTEFLKEAILVLQSDLPAFLRGFIGALVNAEFHNSAPFVFMLHSLSNLLSNNTPVWNEASLLCLRDLVMKVAKLNQVVDRSALQCLLLQIVLNLKSNEVTWKTLALFFGSFSQRECFCRGNKYWKQASDWIWDVFLQRNPAEFLDVMKREVEKAISLSQIVDLISLSRFIVLTADAVRLHENLSALSVILEPLFRLLSTANTRIYLSADQTHEALRLLVHVAAELRPDVKRISEPKEGPTCSHTDEVFVNELTKCAVTLLDYLQRTTLSVRTWEEVSEWELFVSAVRLLRSFSAVPLELTAFAEALLESAMSPDVAPSRIVSLRGLAAICSSPPLDRKTICNPTYSRLTDYFSSLEFLTYFPRRPDNTSHAVWNQLVADYTLAVWSCFSAVINEEDVKDPQHVLGAALNALESARGNTAAKIISVVSKIVPKLVDDEVQRSIGASFQCAIEHYDDHPIFWHVLSNFIDMAYQPCLLLNSDAVVRQKLKEVALEMFRCGETRAGIVNVLVKKCCSVWIDVVVIDDEFVDLMPFVDLILAAIQFGPLHKKSSKTIRYDYEIKMFIRSLGDSIETNDLELFGSWRDDFFVRVYSFTLLLVLVQRSVKFSHFLWTLLTRLLATDLDISDSRPTYHGSSMPHRLKHRIWQAVLILSRMPVGQSQVTELLETCLQCLIKDNQSSVKVMIEWVVVRILLDYPSTVGRFWEEIKAGTEKRVGNMSSLLNIVAMTGCNISSLPQQISFFDSAFPLVLSWCSSHNFSVRTHAQACLYKMWHHCEENDVGDLARICDIVKSCVDFGGLSGAVAKHRQRLLSNFLYSGFDPIADYTIEGIFYVLPQLTLITDEEWIAPEFFHQCNLKQWEAAESIPLKLPGSTCLRNSPPGLWISGEGYEPEKTNVHLFHSMSVSCDTQKKITPWESMIDLGFNPLLGPLSNVGGKRRESGIILVASLIDKAPNLGGLCRTCEIFGVDTLVLANSRISDDSQFQNLSVTSEKWVNILEVRVIHLDDYLRRMKTVGYKLVGVEQTAHSRLLTTYEFSPFTLLLLGNERKGIPADLLNLIEECVEIPQLGLIRSLNVHVSGALFIWEYAKQWRGLGKD